MSKNLQALLKEFQENLNQETNQTIRQAKELKSLQKAIAVVAEAEWDNLSDEEKKEKIFENRGCFRYQWCCRGNRHIGNRLYKVIHQSWEYRSQKNPNSYNRI